MRKIANWLLLLAAAPLFGQLPSNSLTITATRSMVVQPDQVVFGLTVNSPPSATLEQIVGALSGLGISSSNLSGVYNSNATTLQWNFTLTAPLSNLTATIGSLTNLTQTIAQNNSGLTLTFTVNGTQVSQQLQQSQQAQNCSDANLISDATAQAQKLAAGAGMTLGPIIQLSNEALGAVIPASARVGAFAELSANPTLTFVFNPVTYSTPLTCSLSAQFQLLP